MPRWIFCSNAAQVVCMQEIAQHGTHSKACTCAVKALQRLAELEDARQHIIDTGGQPLLEAEASGREAEALVEAVRDPPDPTAQACACQSIIDAVREDPSYSLCAPPRLHCMTTCPLKTRWKV